MENYVYVSKDTIEMVNKVYQALLLAKKACWCGLWQWRSMGWGQAEKDAYGIDELCKKYQWLREVDDSKVTKAACKDIICYPKRLEHCRPLLG